MTTPTPPATRPRNPEAERLIELARNRQMPDDARITTLTMGELRAALRRERRNVVAEIRERIERNRPDIGLTSFSAYVEGGFIKAYLKDGLDRILDEVAGLSDD